MTETTQYPAAPESNPGVPGGEPPHPGGYANPDGYTNPGGYANPGQPYGAYPYQTPPPQYGGPGGEPPFGGGPGGEPRQPRNPWYRRTFVIVAAVAVLAGTAGGIAGAELSHNSSTTVVSGLSSNSATGTDASATSNAISRVAGAVTPSVVEIQVTAATGSQDLGSGVILSSTGLILTNNHVIAAASADNGGGSITIVFSNGKTTSGSIVATDANSDLALVKAQNVSGLTPATLGDSSSVQVGDTVVAIGAPEGLQNTVTSGIVSSLNRKVTVSSDTNTNQYDPFSGQSNNSTVTYNAIQTDASLNPGNSGGPLVNLSGQVVGINSAIYSPTNTFGGGSGGSVGLGFSIPVNQVKQIVSQMEQSSGVRS